MRQFLIAVASSFMLALTGCAGCGMTGPDGNNGTNGTGGTNGANGPNGTGGTGGTNGGTTGSGSVSGGNELPGSGTTGSGTTGSGTTGSGTTGSGTTGGSTDPGTGTPGDPGNEIPGGGTDPGTGNPGTDPGTGTPGTGTPGTDPGTGTPGSEIPKLCFYGKDSKNGQAIPNLPPLARIHTKRVTYKGTDAYHIRLEFSPWFVDNTYGAGSSDGYKKGGGLHRFQHLYDSDHATMFFYDKSGKRVLAAAIDYLTGTNKVKSGYASLGVSGGDGQLMEGEASNILHITTSLDRNFNEHGYVLTQDSPKTDKNYTANPKYPKWNFLVEYEVWVKASAYGTSGYSHTAIEWVHASPSRMDNNTIWVTQKPCPPEHSGDIFW